jgi:hypothetical protein
MKRPWKQYISFSILLLCVALIGSIAHVRALPETEEQMALYITLAAQPLENENSSYELQRAAEHFSDMVLGWTVAPGFGLEGDVAFSGRRQEKQNLLFMLESADENDAYLLLDQIDSNIQSYNETSGTNYVIALHSISDADQDLNKVRLVLGSILLSLLVSVALIFTYDTYHSHRR